MSIIEVSLRREIAMVGQSISIQMLENWEQKIEEHWADLQAGIEEIKNAAHQSDDEQHRVFLMQKRIVNSLVSKVVIDKERNLEVHIRFDLFSLNGINPDEGDWSTVIRVSRAEIYTDRSDIHRVRAIWVAL